MKSGYRCSRCGEYHDGPPFSYVVYAPELWFQIPEAQRDERCELGDETCIIRTEQEHYFIKGNIVIPVLNSDQDFDYTVWVSLSEKNFRRMLELWDDPNRINEPPYFGWLSTYLPHYPQTLSLKTQVHTREVGVRPYIELEPTDHPLAIEQREGITLARVQEIAELLAHGSTS